MTTPDTSPPAGTPVYVAREKIVLKTVCGVSGRQLVVQAISNTLARRIAFLLTKYGAK